ncbi:MAG: SPOR domain-containing protein [Candidatus Protistobacter heckmanni]|nr:SPOR domain-containing protein [Candidatus Protistobacter heckmanni]
MNDPDYALKRSARRRLLSAAVMIIATVAVLPLIFDSKPKLSTRDIEIRMPDAQADAKSDVKADVKPESKPEAKPEAPKAEVKPAASAPAPAPAAAASAAAKPAAPAKAEAKTDAKAESKPAKPAQSASLDKGEEIVKPAAKSDAKADSKSDKSADKSDAKSASGKYLIQIGAFASEERARNWLVKLKASKVPAYIELKKTDNGDRHLLRAGPFADKAAADSADKKIHNLGLTGKLIEAP